MPDRSARRDGMGSWTRSVLLGGLRERGEQKKIKRGRKSKRKKNTRWIKVSAGRAAWTGGEYARESGDSVDPCQTRRWWFCVRVVGGEWGGRDGNKVKKTKWPGGRGKSHGDIGVRKGNTPELDVRQAGKKGERLRG